MSEIVFNKDNFIRLILSNIEYNSSTPERSRAYLESEGVDVDMMMPKGMSEINNLLKKYRHKSDINENKSTYNKRTNKKDWHHISVQRLIAESGNIDPIDEIKTRARALVLDAFERGWQGPPFSPIELASYLNIDVIANDGIVDARIVPLDNRFQIQYNPYQRPTRRNFSIAHEIAHTLFSDCNLAIRNREEAPAENRQLEQLCNAAAAEIQLPYAIFSNDAKSIRPSIEGLIELATKYRASLESVFLRFTEVIDSPCAILIGTFQNDNSIVVDYHKSSKHFNIPIPDSFEIPRNSNAYDCNAPGFTSREKINWDILRGERYNLFNIGITPLRREKKPRIGMLILPEDETMISPDSGKIKIEFGDATQPPGKGKKIIAQLVNTSAALGRGFGYGLAKKYPIVKEELKRWQSKKKQFTLGNTQLIPVDKNLFVFQMLAQKGLFQTASEIPLRYNELRNCLVQLRNEAKKLNCAVHMPAIGAGQAKGNWEIIIGMIHDELVNHDVKVNIWLRPDRPFAEKSPSNLVIFKEDKSWENGKLF